MTTSLKWPGLPREIQSSSFLCVCSMMTMDESTIEPMAMAMPPSDMMFAVTPKPSIGMNETMTATVIVTTGTAALVRCHRKMTMTRLTTISSSTSESDTVSIAPSINSPRS
jgi:hypothetical protein